MAQHIFYKPSTMQIDPTPQQSVESATKRLACSSAIRMSQSALRFGPAAEPPGTVVTLRLANTQDSREKEPPASATYDTLQLRRATDTVIKLLPISPGGTGVRRINSHQREKNAWI
ncbi:uncharacterized protein CIMG_13740 [Coccidioides immitis RS]|uniref:Uncharacterized protein n=1 Tax=Coccidioides immitis (strain RS) TaxID=246410 RepID=A0A0D8JZ62_COCIM|nr:uncharacterized protein CIMG_13740 [Coccidioides immitis RS]KJF61558.1 hypothetical protein CIMG_13740 [Coccidioides immitis RS]